MMFLDRLRAWLDGRRSAWGELRYRIYLALIGFGLTFVAIGIVLSALLIPAQGVFVYGDHVLSGVQVREQVLLPYFGVVLLMTALIYFHLVRVLIIPIERMRRRLHAGHQVREVAAVDEPYDREQLELLEVAVQTAQRQLHDSQAVMLTQLESIEQLEQAVKNAGQRRRALMESLGEAVVEVDGALRITAISGTAAQLLLGNSGALIDKPLFDALRLFDGGRPDWLSHPLNEAIGRTLQVEAAVPCLFNALLLNSRSEEVHLMLIVMPYGGSLRGSGGVLRFQLEGSAAKAVPGDSTGPATLDAESGLPNNLVFRRRVADLIESARQDGRQHTAAIFLIGGLRDEDDPTDFHRHSLAQVLARNLRRSLESDVELYRIGAIAYGVVKVGARPDSMRDLFETIRALCQLELSRQIAGDIALTVRFADTAVTSDSKGIDQVMEELVTQMTDRIAVGAAPSAPAGSDGEQLAQRAKWVSERLLDQRLHLVSQSMLPAAAKSGSRPWLEVFARIEDNDGHWLEPAHFLRAVEHTGETGRLDAAVFSRVIDACGNMPDLLTQYEGISLNVSAQSLSDEAFLNTVIEQTRRSGIAAGRFAIEIDHRAIQLPADALAGLELLRASGVRTIVDGCNDLRSLRLMSSIQPFLIKLSGDFIAAAEHDSVIGAELKAIISSAKVLGVLLSAKNVSGAPQLKKLSELGIGYAQGSGLETLGPILV